MAKSIFLEKELKPNEEMLINILGKKKNLWDKILLHISDTFPKFNTEWKYYGKAWGWCLAGKSDKKQLIYLTPLKDKLISSFIFNDKARNIAKNIGFSNDVMAIIESGKNNPAGGSFDFNVKTLNDLKIVKELLQIKFNC